MYKVNRCLACGGNDLRAHPALVAPFIGSYVLHGNPQPTRLLECRGCELRFFEERYDSREVAKLYDDYRGKRYFAERHRVEPWYSRRANDAIGCDPEEIRRRKARAWEFIRRDADPARVTSVLDYGGDRGQFIPDGFEARRFVHEISGVDPVPGVESLPDPADLAGRPFDLVMLCHVLEHCSDPLHVLSEVKGLAPLAGTLFYLEVPFERPTLAWNWPASRHPGYLGAISRSKSALLVLDFYSTLLRVKVGMVPPFGFLKLHEHLTFFSAGSLRALVEQAGLRVRTCDVVHGDLPPAVACLAESG